MGTRILLTQKGKSCRELGVLQMRTLVDAVLGVRRTLRVDGKLDAHACVTCGSPRGVCDLAGEAPGAAAAARFVLVSAGATVGALL